MERNMSGSGINILLNCKIRRLLFLMCNRNRRIFRIFISEDCIEEENMIDSLIVEEMLVKGREWEVMLMGMYEFFLMNFFVI